MYFYLFLYYLINLSVPVLPLLLLLLLLLLFLLFKCFGNSVPYIHANKAIEIERGRGEKLFLCLEVFANSDL